MNIFRDAVPEAPPSDVVKWAEENVKVDGHSFASERTPQLIEPLRAMADVDTRVGTLVKPVQSGGSTVGEIIASYWARFLYGLIQFNWQDDQKAKDRWKDRILTALESVAGMRWAGGRFDSLICEARFINATLRVQGVIAKGSLDSDTVPAQINEEIHLWAPGLLDKARRRQTLVWNSKALDISNAGLEGDQLEAAYEEGTMEVWETFCPGCGNPNYEANKIYHPMRFRWDESHPELGGLRFDTDAGRTPGGKYNLNKLAPTIRYQMPCGHIIHDLPRERKLPGRYRVTNDGAPVYKRSWTYEGVSVSEIKWPEIVSEWLKATRALKNGDEAPLKKFIQERECRFYGEKTIPFSGQIVIDNTLKKSREGLAGHARRFWFADKQKGYASRGEMTHYWLVIRDVMANCDSQLVFEGLIQTDADLIATLDEHNCIHQAGAVDCGWDRNNVLQFCYRNNLNAQTTSAQDRLFFHTLEKVYRIYSKPEPLNRQIGVTLKFPAERRAIAGGIVESPNYQEPLHWSIHRIGSIKLLAFLRNHREVVQKNGGTDWIKWEVPGDVSEEYKKHLQAWRSRNKKKKDSTEMVEEWYQQFAADHMLICEAGISVLMSMAPHPEFPQLSILAVRLAQMGISEAVIGGESKPQEEEKK